MIFRLRFAHWFKPKRFPGLDQGMLYSGAEIEKLLDNLMAGGK